MFSLLKYSLEIREMLLIISKVILTTEEVITATLNVVSATTNLLCSLLQWTRSFFVGKFTRMVAEMTFKVVMNALVALKVVMNALVTQIAFVVTEITF